ncbi:hypothetical protein [Thiocystis violacea]|uniref:hypothetical protein n=1 Tax=Thiocystis violacea TaxID=13725 RepID=UPI001906AF48|nr:hypothetical protein [Thiocystis violacea]MBK1718953.1 hypothetical protein [Thiocystis violacea]
MKTALIVSLAATLVAGVMTPAFADDQAKIDATLVRLGKVCKNRVAEKFSGVSMADIQVTVGASLQESLDSGDMSLADLKDSGASYNWSVPRRKAEGYCDVDAKGKITQFSGN